MDANKIKIIVCCHKPCELPKDDVLLPVHVGAAISKFALGIQRDDQVNGLPCDNISEKNASYCELTAVYWAWKNIKKIYPDLEYIGLNHYRRYFDFDHPRALRDYYVHGEKEAKDYVIDSDALESLLKKNDCIAAKPKLYPYPLYIDYSVCHLSDDLRTLRSIVEERHPGYSGAFNSVLMRGNALAHYNMNVVGWGVFDDYCAWLFDILGEAENRIDISNYNPVQKRIFGYMAERLWNVYFVKNNFKVKYLPVLWYVDDRTQPTFSHYCIRNIWSNCSFWLQSYSNKKFGYKA